MNKQTAIKILSKHWDRSFFEADTLEEYIEIVRNRLIRFGAKNVPKEPVAFLKYARELGLYKERD